MDTAQARFILFKASAAYPNQVELSQETVSVWIEQLSNIPFERAVRNLDEHICSIKYFPTVAEIVRSSPHEFTASEVLSLAAGEHITRLSEWEQDETPPPDGFWQDVKQKLEGKSGGRI